MYRLRASKWYWLLQEMWGNDAALKDFHTCSARFMLGSNVHTLLSLSHTHLFTNSACHCPPEVVTLSH